MKKNLILLTGIVVLITVLAACGCSRSPKQQEPDEVVNNPAEVKDDSTKVDIFLKAVLIDGSMHLEMYDSRQYPCPVIDGLITVVYGGYTVTWRKAHESNIKNIEDIRLITDNEKLVVNKVQEIDYKGFKLEIPLEPEPDTIKYLIEFTIHEDKDSTYTIDPYLKIPKEALNN